MGLIESTENEKHLIIAIVDSNKHIIPISETNLIIQNFLKKQNQNLFFQIEKISNFINFCENLNSELCLNNFIDCSLINKPITLRSAEFLWQTPFLLNENKFEE